MLVRNDVCVRMAKTEMQSMRETTLRLRKTVSVIAKGMAGKLSLRVRAVIPLPPATLPALAWANSCRLRVKLMKASPVETRVRFVLVDNVAEMQTLLLLMLHLLTLYYLVGYYTGKTAQALGDDAGGHGEAVRRDAARDGGEVNDAEVATVGAASEDKVADGDDGTPARESRDDPGDSNARGDQVIEDPVTKNDASKECADATVDADAEGKERKVAGGYAEPMPEPGDGVGGSNDYTAGSGTRVDTGATRADTAVGDRDNISRDGDQAHGNTCAPVRQINGTVFLLCKRRKERAEQNVEDRRSTSSSCKDDERRETCDEKDKGEKSSDGEPPTYLQFLEEKLPRERHSKTRPEREAMIGAG
ncbi:hypothetical protein PC118_g1372 [Phytophthora cactorum]|uniref:Uncharacterized protein n=1 Tax=Phytophthora cactorum TaxID=29920 RepID=A0A8T1DUQ0_9STRA|nr:hypothetical protein PC115_g1353 [Phytophthora cactorum]KAG2998236.1 hypothetical protein PC118_g1372 [Phytophthora cactorum]